MTRTTESEPLATLPPGLLSQLGQVQATARTPDEAIAGHLAPIQGLLAVKSAFVSLHDADKGLLAVARLRGRACKNAVAVRPGEGFIGESFAQGTVIRQGKTAAIPLLKDEHPIGVLVLCQAGLDATDELLLALGQHLTSAIALAELRDASLRRTRDLETALLGIKQIETSRDTLLSHVSHELKLPLTTIKAQLDMALSGRLGALEAPLEQSLETCTRNADRLLRLINDLLLLSRLKQGEMKLGQSPFGLRALTREALGALAETAARHGVTVELIASSEVYARGDRAKMREAIACLVENGLMACRRGGRLQIVIGNLDGTAQLLIRGFEGKIPDLSTLLARDIVHLHNGSLDVARTPEHGSLLAMSLPLFAGAVRFAEPAPLPVPRATGPILLVEDDHDCREALGQLLELEGYDVVSVPAGGEALQQIDSMHRWNRAPSLVLLDLGLSDGDGRKVLAHLRGQPETAELPVFVISGTSQSAADFRYESPEAIDGFFEKPLNLPRLLARIGEVVASKSAPPPREE